MTMIVSGSDGLTFPNGTVQTSSGTNASSITTGVLAVANGGTGLTSFPEPGTAGNVLTSNGSAWTSTTPSPNNALNQSFTLKSGTSLTAGRCVSINSSGEVGDYPVVNAFGTEYTNAVTTAYSTFSTDGSRVIKVTVTNSPIYAATWTISGGAVSSSGVVTNGGTTVTVTNTNGDQGSGNWSNYAQFFATSATEFFGVFYQGTFNGGNGSKIAMFTVDGSGNVTKSSETTVISGGTSTQSVYSPVVSRMGNVFLCRWSGNSIYRTYTVSGTSYTNATDAEVDSYGGASGVLTSNNIASFVSDTVNYRGAYTTNNFASPTTSTVISDYFDGGGGIFWGTISATRYIVIYKNTSSQTIARTFSVNQADGVLSSVSTFVLKLDASVSTFADVRFAVKSNTELVYTYTDAGTAYMNSMSLDSSGNILGINSPLTNSSFGITPVYTSNNTFFAYYYNNAPKIKTYTANAYSTGAFNIVGVATATTSSSPTTITIGGVAGGFNGLTPGSIYYVDSTTYNGTVTISNASGVRVGKAVSTSQILLGQL